jgi:cardiolipin synthase
MSAELGNLPSPLQGIADHSAGLTPKESRRWLKPRVPKEQLYLLAPARPKRNRLGVRNYWDRSRAVIRSWWTWLLAVLLFTLLGNRIAGIVAAAVSFILYHSSTDSHPAVYPLDPHFGTESEEFRSTIAGATGMPIIDGNRVQLYNNGDEFYPAMLEAIESARSSVTMEQYIFWNGEVGRRFAEAFAEKARAGVPVKLLLDAIGSATLGSEIFKILECGGCQLSWFRPIQWYTIHRANQRNHRKSIIIDGTIAFTGGAGIADHWLGTAANEHEWRDIQIRLEGPAVAPLQSGFAQNWLLATGEILSGREFFPGIPPAGDAALQTIQSSPASGACVAGTMYLIALQSARHDLYIANPYFIPDARVIEMLRRACARGVRMTLMLAGRHNDTWWARQNSVRIYGKLLEAGVDIYEYQPTMLHQKVMVVDGAWATVGTTNLDNRSFALSEETNICFHDPELVERLREILIADLAFCEKIELASWQRRGAWQRAQEIVASLIENQV